ncbi:uncharacterized protein KD926_005310 [Aspergillus affinis]|uniref:uncharacterized protein n=1 Tax=Aspergillus affinis TaxID=1070780 RepID=UPI0022FDD613|nr:uncharacterized protein KD926_005310 [Aspergillus affinis]KAI9042704.1 hypothetical protein KD926_005310 [Aspergillus affinis]
MAHPQRRPKPAHHGPHFEKALLQGKALGPLKTTGVEPYERNPEDFTERMQKEHHNNKVLSDTHNSADKVSFREVRSLKFERDSAVQQAEAILAGIRATAAIRDAANRARQARSCFDQKYPQAQKTLKDVENHEKEATNKINKARTFRKHCESLQRKYEL